MCSYYRKCGVPFPSTTCFFCPLPLFLSFLVLFWLLVSFPKYGNLSQSHYVSGNQRLPFQCTPDQSQNQASALQVTGCPSGGVWPSLFSALSCNNDLVLFNIGANKGYLVSYWLASVRPVCGISPALLHSSISHILEATCVVYVKIAKRLLILRFWESARYRSESRYTRLSPRNQM